jgi:hypothetical protein
MPARQQNAMPFIRTASVARIIEKIHRPRIKMEQIKPGCALPRAIL